MTCQNNISVVDRMEQTDSIRMLLPNGSTMMPWELRACMEKAMAEANALLQWIHTNLWWIGREKDRDGIAC